MSILLYAQPYDISAEGFYFRSADEYDQKVRSTRNSFGQPVEEFEIQFIDGEQIDAQLAEAIGLSQANFRWFLEYADRWDTFEKTSVIIAVGECGYTIDVDTDPSDFDIDIHQVDSMRELAEQFVEDGLFGEVPEAFQFYIDFDAIARDLAVDYSEALIGGERLIYRCG